MNRFRAGLVHVGGNGMTRPVVRYNNEVVAVLSQQETANLLAIELNRTVEKYTMSDSLTEMVRLDEELGLLE